MSDGGRILFKDDFPEDIQDSLDALQQKEAWKVLIVDNKKEVHQSTTSMVGELSYLGRNLQFLHAYTDHQAREALANHPDIAIILLDVMMDSKEASGLHLVHFIREELYNLTVRIILHTDQPGNAPASKVIMEYDINDYKERDELTPEKMLITIISALRNYQLITSLEHHRRSLQKIITASASIFERQSLHSLANGVLSWLSLFLRTKNRTVRGSLIASKTQPNKSEDEKPEVPTILSATGIFDWSANQFLTTLDNVQILYMLEQAQHRVDGFFYEGGIGAWYLKGKSGHETFLYFEMTKNFEANELDLLKLFLSNVALGFNNLLLHKSIDETQKEVIFHITEAMEYRSQETGSHVRRVAEYAYLLAIKSGLDKDEAERLKIASTPHDLGKIGIPDAILNKPGPLTDEEYAIIQSHVYRGYDLLIGSSSPIIQMAARIILQHHERWDGKGYPLGLKGEEIHIHGRIVGVADVFDALSNDRVYHQAWDWDEVFAYFARESGKHFDPNLVRILLENRDELREIWLEYSDDWDNT